MLSNIKKLIISNIECFLIIIDYVYPLFIYKPYYTYINLLKIDKGTSKKIKLNNTYKKSRQLGVKKFTKKRKNRDEN